MNGRWPLGSLALGGAGLVALGVGFLLDRRQAGLSFLVAYLYVTGMVLGVLLMNLIAHVANARWFVLLRRLAEDVAAALPVLAVLFVGLVIAAPALYPWAGEGHAAGSAHGHAPAGKAAWLSLPMFVLRGAICLFAWSAVAVVMRRWSVRRDETRDPALTTRQRALAAAGLPIVALTLSVAAFDWGMSLEPAWYSTIYGVYVFAGGFVSGLGLLAVLAWVGRARLELAFSSSHAHALGKMMFAFVIFWAYIGWSQFFVIWMADLPEEAIWLERRAQGPWYGVAVTLVVAHFGLPFLALLPRGVKRRPELLAVLGGYLLVMHWIDVYWLVVPAVRPDSPAPHWLDLAALLAVGGVTAAWVGARSGGGPLVARGDPDYETSLRYRAS